MKRSGWYTHNVAYVLFAMCFFVFASDAFGQWTGQVTLPESTVAQPGFATFQGRLYLAWTGTDGNRTINVMSSADGLNYGNKVTLSNFTSPSGFGPGLSEAPNCGALLLSYIGGGSAPNFSQSSDGLNWAPQTILSGNASSTAVLNGRYSTIGSLVYRGTGSNLPFVDGFGSCALNTFEGGCFIFQDGFCLDGNIPLNGAPGWAGNVGSDLKAYSAAANNGQLVVGNNSSGFAPLGSEHSDSGPSVAVDSSSGNKYVAWRGAAGGINIRNVNTGGQVISGDSSPNTPVIAVFLGQLFVAWQGGGNAINVAQMNLF